PQNVYLGIATNFGGFSVGTHSINESHEIAFYASRFQYAGTTTVLNGFFKVRGNRLTVLWTSDEPLEGLAGPYSVSNPLIDGLGNVYFRGNRVGDSTVGVWYRADGVTIKPLVALGTASGGSTINTISQLNANEQG